MEVLKLKEWLNKPKPQFRIEGYYTGGEAKYATRIKDEQRFHLFLPYPSEEEDLTIVWFHSDLIHVDVEFTSLTRIGKKGTYEINDLIITGQFLKDAYEIFLKPSTDSNV